MQLYCYLQMILHNCHCLSNKHSIKTKLNHSCVYVSIIISPVTTLAESHHCRISLILQVVRNNLQVNSIHHLHLHIHIHIPTPKSLKVMQVV